ncbi:sensor histidine kinase [Aquimarina rubra]|uniref:Histidine kinase n=1 Tax=Aquimarina rubra TaxID=1920033 RepID=A0ABW5L9X9_9FLAO
MSYAQHPAYIHLSDKDGLPDIEFYSIIEDNQGFIWLAADTGLYRYDGKTFKNYTHPKKIGLSVFGLKIGPDGKVWCNNIAGQFFYVEDDKLVLFTDLNGENKGILPQFTFMKNRLVIFALRKGILLFDLKTQKKLPSSILSDAYRNVFVQNDTLFYQQSNLVKYKVDKQEIHYKNIETDSSQFSSFQTKHFKFKNQSYLYYYNYITNNSHLFKDKGASYQSISLPKGIESNKVIYAQVIENDLWLCTEEGILVYDLKEETLTLKARYFKNKVITKVLRDSEGNYWCTSLRNGVFVIPNIYIENYELPQNLSNITSMEVVKSTHLLCGTHNGNLIDIDISTSKVNIVKLEYDQKVSSILDDSYNDQVYISQQGKSFIFNLKTGLIQEENVFLNAKDLSLISENKFLLASFEDAKIIDFNKSDLNQKIFSKLHTGRSYSSYYSKSSNTMYVGYLRGLRIYKSTGDSNVIMHNKKSIFAIDITETSDGMIWVSTFKDGVIGIKEGKVLKHYTLQNGLLSNQTKVIEGDGRTLWIATDKGLQVLNIETGRLRNLTKTDGVIAQNITDIKIKDSYVYISSNKGVFRINKDKVFTKKKLSGFYFENVLIEDKEVTLKNNYTLPHDHRKIQFRFHTNGFSSQKNSLYRYRLGGTKDNWETLPYGTNQLTFNRLSPGKYLLEVKAVEKDGIAETSSQKINIRVKHPFYQRWWFIISCLVTIIFVLWFYFWRRITKLKTKQQELLEKEHLQFQIATSKLKSLQSQMNPHFIFNAMNSIQNLVLKNDKQAAYTYLTKFGSLLRDNLYMSEKSFVYFDEELSHLKKYLELEKLRFRDDFEYEIFGEETIEDIKIPSTIIQPFVENALKHGLLHKKEGIKTIKLEFYQEKDILRCVITDNGIGMNASREIVGSQELNHESFSTKSIKQKLTLLKKYYKTDIGFYYEPITEGTRVVIKIPSLFETPDDFS